MKTKLLFICRANLQRSPTAVSLFKNSEFYEAKSAGIDPLAETQVTKQAVQWTDIIFVMEPLYKNFILENFPETRNKKIIVLDIPDIYYKNDPELIRILKEKLKKLLDRKY